MTRRLLLLPVSIALALAACGGGGGDTFTPGFRSQLIGNCTDAGQPDGYCVCWVDELDARYSETELLRILQDDESELPDAFLEAGLACAGELDG